MITSPKNNAFAAAVRAFRAQPARHPFTVIFSTQDGAARIMSAQVMLSSPAAFFDRNGQPGEAPEVGADLQEAWEVLAIIPGHVTPAYVAD